MIAILRARWVTGGAERYLSDVGQALSNLAPVKYVTLESHLPRSPLATLGLEHLLPSFECWPADTTAIEHAAKKYALFVNAATGLLLAPAAHRNWLIVFAPGAPEGRVWPAVRGCTMRQLRHLLLARSVRRLCPQRVRRRLSLYPSVSPRRALLGYQRVVSISQFVRSATGRRWGVDSGVLYPGVDHARFTVGPKSQFVLSVGRFAPYANQKHHVVLIDAFRELQPLGWSLHLAGGLEESSLCREYLVMLQRRAAGLSVYFYPDASGAQLAALYSKASIYWHAAGHGVDAVRQPDAVEQFGISIVEAMASGAVPLAYGCGGPAEIIEDGRSGFLWRTAGGLVRATRLLMQDPSLLAEFQEGASRRSRHFDLRTLEAQARAWFLADVTPE